MIRSTAGISANVIVTCPRTICMSESTKYVHIVIVALYNLIGRREPTGRNIGTSSDSSVVGKIDEIPRHDRVHSQVR